MDNNIDNHLSDLSSKNAKYSLVPGAPMCYIIVLYNCKLNTGVLDWWSDKISNLKMLPWALGKCDWQLAIVFPAMTRGFSVCTAVI